jgi:hypothetical protein
VKNLVETALKEDVELARDLRTLVLFIRVYCREKHPEAIKRLTRLPTHDVQEIAGQVIALCPQCTQLLAHAMTKRSNCPMSPKPACKHCPSHCYHPAYRAQIRQVMKFSGRHLLLSGRLDYLLHLLF